MKPVSKTTAVLKPILLKQGSSAAKFKAFAYRTLHKVFTDKYKMKCTRIQHPWGTVLSCTKGTAGKATDIKVLVTAKKDQLPRRACKVKQHTPEQVLECRDVKPKDIDMSCHEVKRGKDKYVTCSSSEYGFTYTVAPKNKGNPDVLLHQVAYGDDMSSHMISLIRFLGKLKGIIFTPASW